jgi:arylsulfatase A-like enzyme
MQGEAVVEQPANQTTLTRRYTQAAVAFMRANRDRPFFLYLPHTFPHWPLAASPEFRGRSRAGLYGDTVEEIDWSTGEILKELRQLGLERRTLVVFTSDNGPWLVKGKDAGTTGGLRGGKATAFEGGIRVPCLAAWPGRIPPGRITDEPVVLTDWFATVLKMAGVQPVSDRVVDSQDISRLLDGTGGRADAPLIFSMNGTIQAIRSGAWKLKLPYQGGAAWMGADGVAPHDLLLFNLKADRGETRNVASANPRVVAQLREQIDAFKVGLSP